MDDSSLSMWMRALIGYVRSGEPDLTNRQMALLMLVYLGSGGLYVLGAYEASLREEAVGLMTLALTVTFVCWITIVNFVYLLMQIVMAADDCSVARAWPRVGAFVRRERQGVMAVFGAVLALVVAGTGVSLLATAALGLVAFVPFVGLAVLPLQLLAWVFRGVVFQYLGLASIGAYLRLYREGGSSSAAGELR